MAIKSNATNAAGVACASLATRGCGVKPKLERVEIEPVGRRDHDLAIDHTAVRQTGKTGLVELGKVAIERPQVPTLDEDLGCAAKDDGAKSVPLGLKQERSGGGKLIGELREHRLDRRRDCETRASGARCQLRRSRL